VKKGAINGAVCDAYVRTQLAPLLRPGDAVIWDNLNVHKSPRAAEVIRVRGAWVLFLPRYPPDLNPIEKAFSKLKPEPLRVCRRLQLLRGWSYETENIGNIFT
jgi:transposase